MVAAGETVSALSAMPATGWVQGVVRERRDWSADLFTLAVHAPVGGFEPGQFLRLGLSREGAWLARAYSVASAPGEPLEFYIVTVPEGALSPALHLLKPGDALGVSARAAGHFTLARVPDAPLLWMISTGTGLAPFLSMLRTEEPWRRFGRIILVHGVRHAVDQAYRDELTARSAAHEGRLTRVPVLSRERVPGLISGRIPACIAEIEDAAGAPLSRESSQVMLCGNPDMLTEMADLLARRDMPRHRAALPGNVHMERYW